MSDLGKSDAAWYEFWERFMLPVSIFRELDDVFRRYGDEARTKLQKIEDPNGNFGGTFTLAGLKIGEDTTEDGRVIVRVTGGADPRTVTVYKATGGGAGDRICAGTANAGALATLTELNSSGVTGTYLIDASVTADSDDRQQFFVRQDWRVHARTRFDGTDAEGEDAHSLDAVGAALDDIRDGLDGLRSRVVTLMAELLVAADGNPRAYGSKFLGEVLQTLLADTPTTDASGRVERIRSGLFQVLNRAMADETTGSEQTFRERDVAAAAGVADVVNTGQGTIASHTPEDQMPTGTVTIECIGGSGQDLPTINEKERFRVSWASDEDDRTKTYDAVLTVGQSYVGEDGFGGVAGITLQRTLSKTGDNSHLHLANVSGATVSGEALSNTSAGDITWEVEEITPTTWRFNFYRSSTLSADTLVAQSPAVAASTAFVASAANGSGLQIAWTSGSAPVDGTTGLLKCNFFTTRNSGGGPDKFTVAVTLDAEGETNRLIARLPVLNQNGFTLNGVPSAELVDDDLVKANTYPDVYYGS